MNSKQRRKLERARREHLLAGHAVPRPGAVKYLNEEEAREMGIFPGPGWLDRYFPLVVLLGAFSVIAAFLWVALG